MSTDVPFARVGNAQSEDIGPNKGSEDDREGIIIIAGI